MNEQEREHFEGLIVKAIQSGKKETSDLVADVLSRLDPAIQAGIEKHVNGKIRAIDNKMDDYIQHTKDYNERIDRETIEWRKNADDKLAIVGSVQGFGKVSAYILGIITTVGGATFMIIKLLEWVRGK